MDIRAVVIDGYQRTALALYLILLLLLLFLFCVFFIIRLIYRTTTNTATIVERGESADRVPREGEPAAVPTNISK